MAKVFEITTAATNPLEADKNGHAEAVFTVTNITSRPLRALAKIKTLGNTKQEWVKLEGDIEHDVPSGGSYQLVAVFNAPADALPVGAAAPVEKHGLQLIVSSATSTDEDFSSYDLSVKLPVREEEKKKPFPIWIIPVAAVVLIIIGVTLWLVLRNKNVEVPDVVSKTFEEAAAELEAVKLVAVQKESRITKTAQPGTVLEQEPRPGGDPVPTGTEVSLIVEAAEPLVEVPDVEKRLIADAKERLTQAGLKFVEKGTEVVGGLVPGQVASQQPKPGEKVPLETTVELVVAAEQMVPVPDVLYKPLAEAKQKLQDVGLKVVEKQPELAGSVPVVPGSIKSQNPAINTLVPVNSTVELVVAAQPTTVPRLVGDTISVAKAKLAGNGLEMGNVWGTFNESNANSVTITSQTPTENTPAARGSKVNVSVPCVGGNFRLCIYARTDYIRQIPVGP